MSIDSLTALAELNSQLVSRIEELTSTTPPVKTLKFELGDEVYAPMTYKGAFAQAAFKLKPVGAPSDFVEGEDLIVEIAAPSGKKLQVNLVENGAIPSQLRVLLPFNSTGNPLVSLENRVPSSFELLSDLPLSVFADAYATSDAFSFQPFFRGTTSFEFETLRFKTKATVTGAFRFIEGAAAQLNAQCASSKVTQVAAKLV